MIKGLSQRQAFALIEEMGSARNLLAYGERVIRTAAFIDTTRDPILTMLSIGSEKLLKLALGLSILEETGFWPSKQVMQNEFRHGTVQMDAALRERLRIGIRGKEYEPYIAGVLLAVEDDPIWPALLDALDMYGRSWRFYNLDILGDRPQLTESPSDYWTEIETVARTSDPTLDAAFHAAVTGSGNGDFDTFIAALNSKIADSMHRLWEMIAILGRHGVLGESGKDFGFEIHPDAVGRQ